MHARGESLCESRMREIRTSGSTRGEVRALHRFLSYSTATQVFAAHIKIDVWSARKDWLIL